jgi:hypothetical protein
VTETDILDRLLRVADGEGALTADGLAAFAEGLRERARLVLHERVQPLELRIQALEAAVASLEKETDWRRQAMTALEAEAAALGGERDRASAAHTDLLAHHRDVMSRAIERFAAAARLPFWKFRECRVLLNEAALLFDRERA